MNFKTKMNTTLFPIILNFLVIVQKYTNMKAKLFHQEGWTRMLNLVRAKKVDVSILLCRLTNLLRYQRIRTTKKSAATILFLYTQVTQTISISYIRYKFSVACFIMVCATLCILFYFKFFFSCTKHKPPFFLE